MAVRSSHGTRGRDEPALILKTLIAFDLGEGVTHLRLPTQIDQDAACSSFPGPCCRHAGDRRRDGRRSLSHHQYRARPRRAGSAPHRPPDSGVDGRHGRVARTHRLSQSLLAPVRQRSPDDPSPPVTPPMTRSFRAFILLACAAQNVSAQSDSLARRLRSAQNDSPARFQRDGRAAPSESRD